MRNFTQRIHHRLKLRDEVRDIKMIAGPFQLACFDHESEFLELGKIAQGGSVADAGHFLIVGVTHSSIEAFPEFVVDEATEHFELSGIEVLRLIRETGAEGGEFENLFSFSDRIDEQGSETPDGGGEVESSLELGVVYFGSC